jgi:hypothetical protein
LDARCTIAQFGKCIPNLQKDGACGDEARVRRFYLGGKDRRPRVKEIVRIR